LRAEARDICERRIGQTRGGNQIDPARQAKNSNNFLTISRVGALVDGGSRILGLPPDAAGMGALRKSDPRKVQLAILLRAHTTVSNAWIAEGLAMGHPGSASRSVSAGRSTKETLKSTEKIGKMLKCVLWYHSRFPPGLAQRLRGWLNDPDG